ncbi:MAG: DUF819 family protein [Bacteroidota bacterium]
MVFWALFIIFFPALILYICHRVPILDKIGAVLLCYAAGMALGNLGLIPAAARGAQEALMTYTIPIALPLLFFSIDVRQWFRLAGVSIFAFLLQTVAVLVSATVAFLVFRGAIGPETNKAVGMLIGCYTGGTINLNAIGLALGVEKNLFMAVNVADMVITPFYLLLAITVMQRILLLVLPPFRDMAGAAASAAEAQDFTSYYGILAPSRLLGLAKSFGLALLIFAVGGGASFLWPQYSALVAILIVSTLGIACSFIPSIRRIEMSFQLGHYIILVFCLTLSSLADLGQLLTAAPAAMAMVGLMVAVCVVVHVLLAAIFRIDADTIITTSIAGIFSPPFIPMVAAALKNRAMIVTGVITGIIGWVIGTYLGIGYAYLLGAIF